jgi:hypothetical protein
VRFLIPKGAYIPTTTVGTYAPPTSFLAVDMLIGDVPEFQVLLAVERGFPASIDGNG